MEDSELLELASLVITMAGIFISIFTIVFSILAFFGFTQISKINKTRKEHETLSTSNKRLSKALQDNLKRLEDFERDMPKRFANLETKLSIEIKSNVQCNHNITLAKESFHRGDYYRAIDFFESASNINPTDYSIIFEIGRCYLYLGASKEAISKFQNCIKLNPNDPYGYIGLSQAYRFINLKESKKYNERAIECDPENHNYYEHMGLLLRMEGEHNLALEQFTKAFDLDRSHDSAMFLSATYQMLGDEDNALLYLDRVRELAREDINVGYRMIWAHMSMWFWYTAKADFQKAIESMKMLSHFWITDYRITLLKDNMEYVFKAYKIPESEIRKHYEALESIKGRAQKELIRKSHISHEWRP